VPTFQACPSGGPRHLIYWVGVRRAGATRSPARGRAKPRPAASSPPSSPLGQGRPDPRAGAQARASPWSCSPSTAMSLPAPDGGIRREFGQAPGDGCCTRTISAPWLNGRSPWAGRCARRRRVMATFTSSGKARGGRSAMAGRRWAARATDVLGGGAATRCGRDILGWGAQRARGVTGDRQRRRRARGPKAFSRRVERGPGPSWGSRKARSRSGYVGGLREIKGPDRLLQAFPGQVSPTEPMCTFC